MNSALKTSLVAIGTLVLAFAILSAANLLQLHALNNTELSNENNIVDPELPNIVEPETFTQIQFLKQHFNDSENRIFIIGSSQVKPLNTTYIQDYLSKNNLNYTVYNLGAGGDRPSDRIKSINMIISAKPKVIVYGIAYRDFVPLISTQSAFSPSTFGKTSSPLPDLNMISTDLFAKIGSSLNNIIPLPENPKLMTETAMKNAINKISERLMHKKKSAIDLTFKPYPNAIFNVSKSDIPKTDIELRDTFFVEGATFTGIGNVNTNPDLIAFEKIINILRQNHIKVIVFTPPQSRYYLDDMPSDERSQFNLLLNKTSQDLNMKIYPLWEKYADLQIWYDPQHVATYNNNPIFSQDISEIITKEIGQ